MATETKGRLFPLGQVVATPGALEALEEAGVAVGTLIARHAAGDWGELDLEDRGLNEQALVSGARIFSVYRLVRGGDLPTRVEAHLDRLIDQKILIEIDC